MKKFLTLKNILICAGALLLLVAFFLSFGAKATIINDAHKMSYNNIIWGCNTFTTDGNETTIKYILGADKLKVMALQLIGLILMLLGAIGAAVVALLVKKPFAKWIIVGLAAIALAGAVFQFFALRGFARAFVLTEAELSHVTDKEAIEDAIKDAIKIFKDQGLRFGMNIAMGIVGSLGAVAIGAGALLPEKK